MVTLISVSKEIKKKNVLSNINLNLEVGNAYLLRGHNGSGKTMLLRMICGLIKPTTGEILKNNDYSYGVIIENPTFIEGQSALYNLKYLASINKKITEEKIFSSLKKVNLFQERNEKVKTFSLGMKQRLGLCQAIMEEPDILLLDEPFNALDDENYKLALELLVELKSEDKILVVAAHGSDLKEHFLFDKVIELNNGKIEKIYKIDSDSLKNESISL